MFKSEHDEIMFWCDVYEQIPAEIVCIPLYNNQRNCELCKHIGKLWHHAGRKVMLYNEQQGRDE